MKYTEHVLTKQKVIKKILKHDKNEYENLGVLWAMTKQMLLLKLKKLERKDENDKENRK